MTRWVNKDAVASISGDEAMPITQSGVDKKVTPDQMRAFGLPDAAEVPYDNSSSGLDAEDLQAAADELASEKLDDAPSDGTGYVRKDGAWAAESGGGGGGSETLTIVTEASAFTADPATHSGRSKYIRAGGDVTFDSAETYTAGEVYQVRATAALDLVEDGVTLTPPAGGTLGLDAGMSVQVVMTSTTAGDVIGQTVAA